jgi:hypothetical protein
MRIDRTKSAGEKTISGVAGEYHSSSRIQTPIYIKPIDIPHTQIEESKNLTSLTPGRQNTVSLCLFNSILTKDLLLLLFQRV